jgi:predicted CopG family antitoxin
MAMMYGSYSIAVATGGLSLVAQRLIQRRKANTDVCAEILEEAFEENEKKRKEEAGKGESH